MSGEYRITDELTLWWLGRPQTPVRVGTLRLLRATRGVSLQYDPEWLRNGFALSEDLPLTDIEHRPVERDTAAGAVDDARPDRWGERVVRFVDKPPRLSLLEYLYFAGDDRFGALGVSASAQAYAAHRTGPLPTLRDVGEIHELVRKVLDNEPVPESKRRLIAPGATLGGARPKALIELDDAQWVVKFAEPGEPTDVPLIEHASMTLAGKADIRVAPTRPVRLIDGHALAVLRFDREGTGASAHRLHAQSAHVALRAEASTVGYPELAQLLRRRAPVQQGIAKAQMRELFRRMVFNILMDNTDDHEKNHVLLMDDAQHLVLAPAFDVLPAGQGLGYQQLRVGRDGADSTIENARSEAALFGLSADEATVEAARVARACSRWKSHFTQVGVRSGDIEYLSQFIDRDFLRQQRSELTESGGQGATASPRKRTPTPPPRRLK
ncbi:MAG TPA: type II toxin-antitoxin system HipA family toxin [Burkholderiaceae bacterium]|jgi:serine/threonine-protein kinase HipA|nr:type II toxin-antitoxin system HipA family toxin [Burkholderiaceae bacterium]